MRIKYESNNSGGYWWLDDSDWFVLEAAGWEVYWVKDDPFYQRYGESETWLGCYAKSASKDFDSVGDAIREWEQLTDQSASDEGCNCCGAPHTFYWGRAIDDSLPKDAEYGVCSGEECLKYLFENKPMQLSKRELLERL